MAELLLSLFIFVAVYTGLVRQHREQERRKKQRDLYRRAREIEQECPGCRVYWMSRITGQVGCGSVMPERFVAAAVRIGNKNWPQINHWMSSHPQVIA